MFILATTEPATVKGVEQGKKTRPPRACAQGGATRVTDYKRRSQGTSARARERDPLHQMGGRSLFQNKNFRLARAEKKKKKKKRKKRKRKEKEKKKKKKTKKKKKKKKTDRRGTDIVSNRGKRRGKRCM